MSRYTGPKCRLCRREQQKLFLKGERCESQKCAITRRQTLPGQHGKQTKRLSEYAIQLREKQKVKRIYGVLEQQFKNYFKEAKRHKGLRGAMVLIQLERRLDNVVYRLGLAVSRAQAREIVIKGKILVNDKKTTFPSYSVKKNDIIKKVSGEKPKQGQKNLDWLIWDAKKSQGKVVDLPKRESITEDINESLIIAFYSR